MDLMKGKRGIIFGVAKEMSTAWGIARQLAAAGAELAFSCLNPALEKRVRPWTESLGAELIPSGNVARDDAIEAVFAMFDNARPSLLFDLPRGVAGEPHYVDAGFNVTAA